MLLRAKKSQKVCYPHSMDSTLLVLLLACTCQRKSLLGHAVLVVVTIGLEITLKDSCRGLLHAVVYF
jgi:hypothetical protein